MPACNFVAFDLLNISRIEATNFVVNKSDRISDLVLFNLPICIVGLSHNTLSTIDALYPPLEISIIGAFINEPKLSFSRETLKIYFYKADYVNIYKELWECNWEEILGNSEDVNDMVQKFYEAIGTIIEIFVQKQTLKKHGTYLGSTVT